MDEAETVKLHYAMLEYLYDNHKLSASCFNYVWEEFLRDSSEFSNLTADELKKIFWTEIARNIEAYKLLTKEQKEYFNPDDFIFETNYEEDIQSILEHNEPKAGIDFTFHPSTSAFGSVNDQTLRQQDPEEMMKRIRDAFSNPTLHNNVFDDELTEVNEEDTRINIIAQKPTSEFDMGEHPLEAYRLLFEDGKDLTHEEIVERMTDPNTDITYEDLTPGLQQLVRSLGDTVLYTHPNEPVKEPELVSSTPIVEKDANKPQFRFTRSRSVSMIEASKRREAFENMIQNKSPLRRRRAPLFTSSDTNITKNAS